MSEIQTEQSFAESGGVRLYVESTGSGIPILFVHELAGDYGDWQPQVRFFAERYRCVTFNARGYPPSDVPESPDQYSVTHAVEDIAAVMRHCQLECAHVVGLSMGGYAALRFAMTHPEMVRSIVAAGTGHGSDPATRESFLRDTAALADRVLELGLEAGGRTYLQGPWRRRFRETDPVGFEAFSRRFTEHSAVGTALTIRGCQLVRPMFQELEQELQSTSAPTLIVSGDDDDPCVVAGMYLKHTLPDARLAVVPRATHTVNLERPEAFNRVVSAFLAEIDGHPPGPGDVPGSFRAGPES